MRAYIQIKKWSGLKEVIMEENCSIRVSAYVTRDEAAKITAIAKAKGLSVSQYLRAIILNSIEYFGGDE